MIDWIQVNSLREDVGRDSFDDIVAVFLEEVEEVIVKLRDNPDRDTLVDDLHFLKGSALNLGFTDFSGQCQLGETASVKGQAASVDIPKILESYDTTKARFLADLPSALET